MKNQDNTTKYFFVAFFLAIIYIVFLIIRPFLGALLTAAVLAYLFHPVYEFLLVKTKGKNLSAFIVSVIVIFLITVPSAFIINEAAQESEYLYIRGKQKLITGDILGAGCNGDDGAICRYSKYFSELMTEPKVRFHLEDAMKEMSLFFSQKASGLIFAIPTIILQVFITFFAMFYLLRDGKYFVNLIVCILPIKQSHKKKIISSLSEMTFAVIYGTILVAFVQGVAAGIGFWIFGLPSVLMLSMIIMITALLPFLGTAIVWIPVSISMILGGLSTGNNFLVWNGLGLMIYCAIIVSSIDNVVRPFIIGKKSGMHPLLVLVGALGGMYVFGFIGFIVGPIMLELFVVILSIYKSEKDDKKCFT
jgi:predicted PurR-regulated permease PerM